jgi:adenylyltransferase/sulfurtransferase
VILSDAQLDRYARQIVLPEWGGRGQAALNAARVAVVGAGGLGCPVLAQLAGSGVGAITIIDDDVVDVTNLHRQHLFITGDAGQPKALVAAARLAAINPHVAITPRVARLDGATAAALLAGHDLVIDGSDSFATRLAVNDAAIALGVPLVSGAVGPWDGQVAVFKGHLPDQPCYRCLVGTPADAPDRNCAATGVVAPIVGIVGNLMALEALRELAGLTASLAGRLTLVDGRHGRFRSIALPKDPACPACRAA